MQTLTRIALLTSLLCALATSAAAQVPPIPPVPVYGLTQLDAPPGAAETQAGGSYTLSSDNGGSSTLTITETSGGKVTRFSTGGTSYKWDPKRKHYHATAGDGPIKWEYYEFTSSGDEGVYNYKKRAVAGNVLDSGTASMD